MIDVSSGSESEVSDEDNFDYLDDDIQPTFTLKAEFGVTKENANGLSENDITEESERPKIDHVYGSNEPVAFVVQDEVISNSGGQSSSREAVENDMEGVDDQNFQPKVETLQGFAPNGKVLKLYCNSLFYFKKWYFRRSK